MGARRRPVQIRNLSGEADPMPSLLRKPGGSRSLLRVTAQGSMLAIGPEAKSQHIAKPALPWIAIPSSTCDNATELGRPS